MPNWRNKIEYDFTKNFSPEEWAWEYLKRNRQYILDYEHTAYLLSKRKNTYNNTSVQSLKDPEFFKFTPPLYKRETFDQWISRCERQSIFPGYQYYPDIYVRKWKLIGKMRSPAHEHPPKFKPYDSYCDLIRFDSIHEYYSSDNKFDESSVVISFDLKYSIDEQLSKTRQLLKNQQAERNIHPIGEKPQKAKNPIYLRVLDAYSENAKPSEIASIIFPHIPNNIINNYGRTNRLKDTYKQAIFWTHNYYVLLKK